MNIELLYAFRVLDKVNGIEAQQKIQSNYLNKSYRKILVKHFKNNILFKYLYFLELFRIFTGIALKKMSEGSDTELIYLAATENQHRQLSYMKDIFPERDFMTLNLRGNKRIKPFQNLSLSLFCKCFFIGLKFYQNGFKDRDAIEHKNTLLFFWAYIYSKNFLSRHKPKAVLVANDHSTIPMGFAAAARTLSIKTLYIQHAHITYDLPPLRFDLAILDGECAKDIYRDQGSLGKTKIIYRGLEGQERAMDISALPTDKKLTVGFFVNVFEEEKLLAFINDLLSHDRIEKILLREHPAFPFKLSPSKLPDNVIKTGLPATLWDNADECDVVIGGNSSFHLSVLKYGVPTIFCDAIDYIKYDDYSFIKHDILFEIQSLKNLNFKKVAEYYNTSSWVDRFRYFDAGYGGKTEELKKQVRDVVLQEILSR